MRRPLHVSELDLVSSRWAGDADGKLDLEELVALVPVNLRNSSRMLFGGGNMVKIRALCFILHKMLLILSVMFI